MTGLIILGVLFLIGAVALTFFKVSGLMTKVKVWQIVLSALIGIILLISRGSMFYAEAGYQYMVQYPWGTQVHVTKPGYNLRLWGDTLSFKKIITVRLTEEADENSETASAVDNSVGVLFNDGVRAKISHSTRFRLPIDEENFLKMVRDFRTEQNLINNSLIPISREVIRNAARELGAQKYISGGGGVLENNIVDQMQHGIVLLETHEETVIPTEETINPDTGEKRTIKHKPVIKTTVVRKKNKDNSDQRKDHPITNYGIKVTQSTVENVNFEPKFKKMIEQQRDAAARANVEKQKAKEAEYAQKRIVAEGEKDKAARRAQMEQEQVVKLITAETAKKEEQFRKEQAQIALERAEIEAQDVKVRAQAEADARKLKMQADGALEQKLDAWVKSQEAWAAAAAHQQLVPTTVVGGSGKDSTSANQYIDILMANQAKQLGVDVTP